MDTAALREEPMRSGGTPTGRSTADSAGKRVAGHPEGEGVDRGRETEESRCDAVSGNGGSSPLIVASLEMYMLISEPTAPSAGEVVGEHSVTSRIGTIGNVGDPEIGFGSREVRERLPRGGGDSPVKSIPCCEGKSIFKWFIRGTGWVLFWTASRGTGSSIFDAGTAGLPTGRIEDEDSERSRLEVGEWPRDDGSRINAWVEELVLMVLLWNRNRDFAREETYEAPPWGIASGKRAGVVDFVTCPCNLDGNAGRDFVSFKGREMVTFPKRPFSESVE
jgi:hypothetical protein